MYPSEKLKKLIIAVEKVAEDWKFGVTPLTFLSKDNMYCFQPYDTISQLGPEERTVRQFLHEVLWKRLPVNLREGLKIEVASLSKDSELDVDYCDPDFPCEPRVYYIRLSVS